MAKLIQNPTRIPMPVFDYSNVEASIEAERQWVKSIGDEARRLNGGQGDIVGRSVKFSVADGYAVYVVWGLDPLSLVHVATGDAYSISGAYIRGLTRRDIEAQVAVDRVFEDAMDEHEKFYSQLPIGSIVHYDNGFAQFIRAERIEGEHGKRLRPLALIGNWTDLDLPRRNVDGSVTLGHQVEWIAEGRPFEPNYGSIWEAMDEKRRKWSMRGVGNFEGLNEVGRARRMQDRYIEPFDPTVEEPIDLTPPPPPEGEDAQLALLARKVQRIAAIVDERPDEPTVAAYNNIIARVAEALAGLY